MTRQIYDVTEAMLTITALDPGARLAVSDITGEWYVSADLYLTDGEIRSSVNEHRPEPREAVLAYLAALTVHGDRRWITGRPFGAQRAWRWNGAAFAEVVYQ